MNTLHIKIVIAVFIAIVIYISGLWLIKSGKPYSIIVLTTHKLISFGILVYIVISCFQMNKVETLTPIDSALCLLMFVAFLSGIVSGGFLSTSNPMPSFVQIIHRISSIVSALFTGILMYLLRGRL